MKILSVKSMMWIIFFTFLFSGTSFTQTHIEYWIEVTDNQGSSPLKMIFGNAVGATNGLNLAQLDSINSTIIEREAPPPNPDLSVVWRPPWRGANWGNGLLTYDFRPLNDFWQRDTFVLKFMNQQAPDADIIFTWPNSIYLRCRCDSMFLVDTSGRLPKIDMFKQQQFTVHAAGDSGISILHIIKKGANPIIDCEGEVVEDFHSVPHKYELYQNYPNPFNPTTSIKYQLPFSSQVKLKIYNVLGEKVALLTDEIQQAGFKSATWNATDAASGVYFYKLEAISVSDPSKIFTQVKKMLLVR
ncbi:MAG: T9SS type A sorting domain-containing protein [Ignavibacteriales bacterium]|nr:T9SS type A sorting domain-containing protein [Ignavibacteriales bacterium]